MFVGNYMKKILLLSMVLVLSIASLSVFAQGNFELQQPQEQTSQSQVIQWTSVVKESCTLCAEGQVAKFDVNITNIGNSEFAVRSVALIDADNVVFASGTVDTLVSLNSTKTFSIDGIIPPASKGKTLYYKTCFVLSSGAQSTESCENSIRRLFLQNPVETSLMVVYVLLSAILIAMVVFFLVVLRKLARKSRDK